MGRGTQDQWLTCYRWKQLPGDRMGYRLGQAFAAFYATMGLPRGWLADRGRRTWLVAEGIALWSLATAASDAARSFGHLLVARMRVGVGEAVLSPCAMSMIGGNFPPERRGKPVATYSMAVWLGGGIASLIGAAVLAWAKTSQGLELPLVGEVKAWQAAFVAVGLLGLLLALPFLFLREPERRQAGSDGVSSNSPAMAAYVGQRWPAFLGLVTLVSALTIVARGHGFLASAFARRYAWEVQDYALVNGALMLVLGPATVAMMGVLCDRWRSRGD